jgi:hypothetical protein
MHMLIMVNLSVEQLSVFLGYGVKAYTLWNPEAHKSLYSRNVKFNESTMFTSDLSTSATNQNLESISV